MTWHALAVRTLENRESLLGAPTLEERVEGTLGLRPQRAVGFREADISINGKRVIRILDRVVERRGKPAVITCDNGPEFAGQRLDE